MQWTLWGDIWRHRARLTRPVLSNFFFGFLVVFFSTTVGKRNK